MRAQVDPDEAVIIEAEALCAEQLFDQWPVGPIPESFCETLRIKCNAFPGVGPRMVEVRRTEPDGGATMGNVVFVGGGFGTSWYGDKCIGPSAAECEFFARDLILAPVVAAGYQIIEYKWLQTSGWMEARTNGGDALDDDSWLGLAKVSCRVDRLIRFLRGNRHPGGPYCGVGQSGGSVQLAYTVAHHGAHDKWDSLVLTGGPPITDEVFGCKEDGDCAPPGIHKGCFDEEKECLLDQAYGNPATECRPPENSVGPCQVDPLPSVPNWIDVAEKDSLVTNPTSLGDYDYPFAVHFIYGRDDNSEAPPQGMKFRQTLINGGVTETSCESLPGVAHGVPWGSNGDTSGPDRVLNRVLDYCVASPPDPPSPFDQGCTADHVPVP